MDNDQKFICLSYALKIFMVKYLQKQFEKNLSANRSNKKGVKLLTCFFFDDKLMRLCCRNYRFVHYDRK